MTAEEKTLPNPYADRAEVERLTGYKKSKALELIRELNAELEDAGKITVRARVPRRYLYERLGIELEEIKT